MKVQGIDFEPLYTPDEVCEIFQISRRTLCRLMKAPEFPKPVRVTRRLIRFKKRDIAEYMGRQNQ